MSPTNAYGDKRPCNKPWSLKWGIILEGWYRLIPNAEVKKWSKSLLKAGKIAQVVEQAGGWGITFETKTKCLWFLWDSMKQGQQPTKNGVMRLWTFSSEWHLNWHDSECMSILTLHPCIYLCDNRILKENRIQPKPFQTTQAWTVKSEIFSSQKGNVTNFSSLSTETSSRSSQVIFM